MAVSSYWKNREQYTLLQVAYIAIGEEPKLVSAANNCEHSAKIISIFNEVKGFYIESGYLAVGGKFTALSITVSRIEAIEIIDCLNVPNVPNFLKEPDEQQSMLTQTIPEYLDPKHPMFSNELSIAIRAWSAVLECNPDRPKRGSRKKLIENWLEANHSSLTKEAKIRIATLLNPDKNGGVSPSC